MQMSDPASQPAFLPGSFWRLLALAVFVALVWVRIPEIMHYDRFWAEEGTVYFARAWTLPWWQALWAPASGYLNLAANAAGLAARYLFPLHDAPRVTTLVAFAFQALPAVLLVTARDAWLRRPAVLFAAILILAMPPVCDEVWLNTTNSQFHLALAAALCLALEVPIGVGAPARRLLLFLAPLCSPGCVALAPLFVARAALDRQKGRAIQAGCIVAGAVLQFALFYTSTPGRGHISGPATAASIFAVKHLAIPFLGEQGAVLIADGLRDEVFAGHYPIAAIVAVAAVCGLILAAVVVRRRSEPGWLLVAGLALACLSYYGALEGGTALISVVGENRYAFAPCMLFALAVLALAATAADRIAQGAWAAVVWLLVIATQQTVLPQDPIFVQGPRWKTEIARWRANPGHPLAIWPAGWAVIVPPHSE